LGRRRQSAQNDRQTGRFIERWPSAHKRETEMDVEIGLDHL
jgi:carboxymethylenebutenolidase